MSKSNIAAIIAKAIPVFPLVGSISFIPGLISPRFKASFIMLYAGRSLTLPPGFWPYNFANILTFGLLKMFLISTKGVLPIMF